MKYKHISVVLFFVVLMSCLITSCADTPLVSGADAISPELITEPLPHDTDDPAIGHAVLNDIEPNAAQYFPVSA